MHPVPALVDHAPWFNPEHLRRAELFGPTATFAFAVPATRVRIQRSAAWTTEAVDLVELLVGSDG
ncbi:MAG: hypothetical protein ACYCV7_11320 [Acidimicrobiales bacterium]